MNYEISERLDNKKCVLRIDNGSYVIYREWVWLPDIFSENIYQNNITIMLPIWNLKKRKRCWFVLNLRFGSRLMLLRFHRPELVSRCFDRTHSMAIHHFHKRLLVMLLDCILFFLPSANASVCCKSCCTNEHYCHCCYNYHVFGIHLIARERVMSYLHWAKSGSHLYLIFFLLTLELAHGQTFLFWPSSLEWHYLFMSCWFIPPTNQTVPSTAPKFCSCTYCKCNIPKILSQ